MRVKYKPSKPMAVISVVFGIGMIVVALTTMDGANPAFLAFWCVAVVAIVGVNVWAAFSEKGSLATFVSDSSSED